MCSEHLRLAAKKSGAQIWCDRIGLALGVVIGLAVCTGLLLHWSATGQGPSAVSILLAIFVGLSMGFTFWTATHFWATPQFASAETKAIINAVRITKYDPFRPILELTFSNNVVAELVRRANLDILAEDLSKLKRFQISAHILSHDIRLNTNIKTIVPLAQVPDLQEARELLEPAIEWVMLRNLGRDCFYDIDAIKVEELT